LCLAFKFMLVSGLINETRRILSIFRQQGKSIGLIPTMGALHEGHLSLIDNSLRSNDVSVISIFINPTQFNERNDFNNYPRDIEKDLELARLKGCDLAFVPSEQEIYPEKDQRIFDFGTLDKYMEGQYRPGHFNGVAQIVSRLFSIIEPDRAYFGEKDFQQLVIIKKLVKQLEMGVEIVSCPIIREHDGLAMSSRNQLLSPAERKSASRISAVLMRAKDIARKVKIPELREFVISEIDSDPNLKTEYFEMVLESDMIPIKNWPGKSPVIACIAVKAGQIRLIDNIKFS
jgi:pantoate--beta-alanine ligase